MAVSREEYLKRYLSGPTQEKKKSKKKASKAVIRKAGLKILDDDVDFKSLLPNNIKNSLDDDLADDNPVVIDLGLDDRPEQIKELERMRNSKRWKAVVQDKDDSESLQQPKLEEEIRKEREAVKRSSEHSNSSSDMRKIEKEQYDSESDASPASSVRTAQQERHFVGNDTSIGKRRRQDSVSSSDKSPPRQRQDSTDGSDNSPKRRRLDSAGSVDNSPPRQTQGRRAGFSNSSPSRKRKDSADNEDNSPPRRKQGRNPSSDNSPRRKQGRDPSSDNSPPRRRGKDSAGSVNNSPPRRRHNRSTHSDSSPPRRRKDGRADSDSDISPPRKENKSALHSFQQKKDRTYQSQDATNNPQVIYRKDGKKRDLQAEKKSKEEEEAKKAALAAKYKEWNKGLKQKEIVQERIADALNVVQKPLARYRDDQDLDSHLRAQLHQEDPMLAFIKKKKSSAKGGEKPRYRGPQPPPNRFNIEPGYRWDGVDRSSGFEKKFFSKLSEDKAKKDVAYKWSVEDM